MSPGLCSEQVRLLSVCFGNQMTYFSPDESQPVYLCIVLHSQLGDWTSRLTVHYQAKKDWLGQQRDCCTTTSSFREEVRMSLPQALKCDAQLSSNVAQSISSAVVRGAFPPSGAHAKKECTHIFKTLWIKKGPTSLFLLNSLLNT